MQKFLKAFQIRVNGKVFDYRLGDELNLDQVRTFFEKKYIVRKLYSGGRHILGVLEKNNKVLFLKLATTEGISAVTENEYRWNKEFNKLVDRRISSFWVPQNKDYGIYEDRLFYLITDKLNGELLVQKPEKAEISTVFLNNIPSIIRFSELIQQINIVNLSTQEDPDYRNWFFKKTKSWYNDIPEDIRKKYQINNLLKIVENGFSKLQMKPRHGDFTPWHLIKLKSGQLGLIDGEHTMANGVEYYDIGYFIQRIFSVLQNPNLAEKIFSMLAKNKYDIEKLAVILATRAIGGFLDESLKLSPNYKFSNQFKNWVISLN